METEVRLKIADTLILLESRFPLLAPTGGDADNLIPERFSNFLYQGAGDPDIIINVNMVDKLPVVSGAEDVFITYHYEDRAENWRLQKKNGEYIYHCPLEYKRQLMLINRSFDRVTAYLEPKKQGLRAWNFTDVIYDFLQVLLINYFAYHKQAILVHSIGLKDSDGRGLLFAGKSGCGKSTTARIWHKHSNATVLNDDRMIVRRPNERFFIHGSCWHGEFSDYLESRIESAPLERLFFIYHAPKNQIREISAKDAFNLLYQALFPVFWDKDSLETTVSFCQDLVKRVPCVSLGFVNNQEIIDFVRKYGR